MKKYISELIGTYGLVFFGTGSIIINELHDGIIGHLGISICFGLVVTLMIYMFGSISGAHINPVVTISFSFIRKSPKQDILFYIIAQLIGAVLASLSLRLMFAESLTLGETIPSGSWQQSFVLEIILTYFLVGVILFVSENRKIRKFTAIAVGAAVMLDALFGGPVSGASMNPVRSLAPAIVSGNMSGCWIYIVAPLIGSLLGTITFKYLHHHNPKT